MKAVVLLSGGMDSTTALAQAYADGADKIVAVSAKYGSKHAAAEGYAAARVVDYYKPSIEWVQVELPKIFGGGDSALMGEIEMPQQTYQEIMESEGPSPTVVPFRNANLISAAVAIAITHKAELVYAGMHGTDAHNWAYPDCTPEFLGAMANAVYVGSYREVRLVFPFIWMSKTEVVTRGARLGAPLHLTYSCYEGGRMHCGKCPTCVERMEAFKEAGYVDPVPYEEYPDDFYWDGVDRIWPGITY